MNKKVTDKDHREIAPEPHLHNLAGEFLDLWQANLMTWASDPEASVYLPQPGKPVPNTTGPEKKTDPEKEK